MRQSSATVFDKDRATKQEVTKLGQGLDRSKMDEKLRDALPVALGCEERGVGRINVQPAMDPDK